MITQRWQTRNVMEVLTDCTRGHRKIPKSDYLTSGKTLVVDQSSSTVPYFTDEETDLNDAPYIVFGDHTREIKFVTQSFLPGADGVKILKPSKDVVDPKYIFHYLKSNPVTNLGYSRHFKLFREIEIPLPPLEEQRRIAATLDEISQLDQKLNQQEQFLQGMVLAFVNDLLETTNTQGSRNTRKLEDFGTFHGGMTPSKSNHDYWDGTIRWFTTKDLDGADRKDDSEDHLTELALESTSAKLIPQEGIAFSLRGMSLVHRLPMSIIPSGSSVNQDLKVFVPSEPDSIDSIFWLIRSMVPLILTKVSSSAHGTRKLDFRYLKELPIPDLTKSEKEKITSMVDRTRELNRAISKKRVLFQELQASLSARAFTGEL